MCDQLWDSEHVCVSFNLYRKRAERCLKILWAEGVKSVEIHRILWGQFGDNTLSRWSVYDWIEMLISILTIVMYSKCMWQLSTLATDERQEEVRAIFKPTEVSVILEEIALQPGISEGMVCSLVYDILVLCNMGAQTSDRRA